MNLAEYFLPILQLQKPINELRSKFAVTLNKFLPENEQIKAYQSLDDDNLPTNENRISPRNISFLNENQKKGDNHKQKVEDDPLSIRKYQAVSSNLLSGEKPNILEAYMELVV